MQASLTCSFWPQKHFLLQKNCKKQTTLAFCLLPYTVIAFKTILAHIICISNAMYLPSSNMKRKFPNTLHVCI